MAPFSKPETVLKQAEGLVSVGQTHAALQSLTEMFSSKRFRSTPLASLEPIMLRFVELCVDMRKGRTAKEGLMQYKNIAQNTSVQSIDVVITRFVQLADAKVREAQEKAAVQVAVDVDDLEASETPESILLGAVSGDQSRDRTDRALVTPWLKFLWESYRTSLETLKNNARLEAIYQQIAQQAFKFCLKHTRKVEFRRLCETLRLHLANVAKYSHQPHSINLSDPDTLQHHLDTRFAQLHTSVELELWQEAFRSVEDVHNLLTMAKKTPRPAMMATYYEKLTRIFLMSGNALYHAAAWGRYYAVVFGMGGGGRSEEEMARLAGQVLVSALAVPVGMQVEEIAEEGKTRTSRLTALLGLSRTPTRAGLLKDAISRSILPLSPPTIQSLYSTLEASFSPLTLCAQTTPLLLSLAQTDAYAPYVPLLQRALLSRLLAQLAQVYSVVRIDMVLELTRPLEELRGVGMAGATETGSETAAEGAQLDPTKKLTSFAFDAEGVQAYAMGCARRGELNVRVDHARGCIEFVDEAFAGVGEGSSVSASASASVATIGVGRDSSVQPSTADVVRTRLSKLAVCLHDSLIAIDRSAGGAVSEVHATPTTNESTTNESTTNESTTALISAALAERRALHLRRALTARRRELVSELSVRKEKEETSRRAEASRREKEEEERRVLEDMRRREVERARSQYESVQKEEAKKLARKLAEGGLKGVVLDDMENLNTDTLLSLQVSQLEKEKKDLNERLRIAAKRVDHIERAYRKEELPLLAQDYAQQQSSDRDTFLAIQVTRREGHRQSYEQDVEAKRRLVRMVGDWEGWREVVLGRRGEAYERRRQEARRRMEEEMEKRKKSVLRERAEEKRRVEEEERERREKREEEERLEAERLAEVERKRAEEEAALEAAAAKKREEEEKIAAVRREREEARAKADEIARLQAKREEEAEKRARERFAGGAGGARAPQTPAAGGAWRSSRVASAASGTLTPAAGGFASSRASLASPARPESPNAGAGEAPRKYVPGAFKREAAARLGSGSQAPPPRTESPQPRSIRKEEPKGDDDGFQKVPEKQVWRATRR